MQQHHNHLHGFFTDNTPQSCRFHFRINPSSPVITATCERNLYIHPLSPLTAPRQLIRPTMPVVVLSRPAKSSNSRIHALFSYTRSQQYACTTAQLLTFLLCPCRVCVFTVTCLLAYWAWSDFPTGGGAPGLSICVAASVTTHHTRHVQCEPLPVLDNMCQRHPTYKHPVILLYPAKTSFKHIHTTFSYISSCSPVYSVSPYNNAYKGTIQLCT